ncbi:ATPase [Chromatiales bacterium (ex Bugula neritina AB1)]|nr:ATPase [Chromatiales bacterium (ex Bugula neritina AB1)]
MTWKSLQSSLAEIGYIASDELAMALHLSVRLERPLLLEGAAGVGKTEVAKMLAQLYSTRLIRLQCYEGLDASTAIYEWNYQRQLLSVRASADKDLSTEQVEEQIFSDRFLLKRPLLEAITQPQPPVLLIDEIDRADEEFEAYLLEILSDFQVSIPELGTIEAVSKPHVILTSNGSRDLSDALRRRCFYTYVEYPDAVTELAILNKRLPGIDATLAEQIVGFVQALRKEELDKNPGVAEMLDWAAAVAGLGVANLSDDPIELQATLICLLKTQSDKASITTEVTQRLAGKVVQ